MKKLIIALLLGAIACGATACSDTQINTEAAEAKMFTTLERNSYYRIVYHTETKVMYVVSNDYYNVGTFTLLVNPDGTPMLYKE